MRLAVQVLGNSIATALSYCQNNAISGFEDSGAVIEFMTNSNNLFGIMNPRNKLSSGSKKPISLKNIDFILTELDKKHKSIFYFRCLKAKISNNRTNRRTSFLGFLMCMISFKTTYGNYWKNSQ